MAKNSFHLDHGDYTILNSMANPLLSTTAMCMADSMPIDFPGVTREMMFELVQSTIGGEENLEAGAERSLWNPLFNYGVDKQDSRDRDSCTARNFSTRALLKDHLEK